MAMMNETSLISLTRKLFLSMAALFLWVALGGGVIQYLSGSKGIGIAFILIGLIVLIGIARGRLMERYIGRRIAKANIYFLFPLLILFAGSEIYSFISLPTDHGITHWAQGIFSFGFLLLVLLLTRQFIAAIRS
jgi:hypothetical protein